MRRIAYAYPRDALQMLADYYRKVNLDRSRKRAKELTFRATDGDWSSGEGPEVAGPVIALVQAITGRRAGLDQLYGEGVAILKERI